jgi:hypothetical protein
MVLDRLGELALHLGHHSLHPLLHARELDLGKLWLGCCEVLAGRRRVERGDRLQIVFAQHRGEAAGLDVEQLVVMRVGPSTVAQGYASIAGSEGKGRSRVTDVLGRHTEGMAMRLPF